MTGSSPLLSVGDDRSLRVTIDYQAVAEVIQKAPKIVHFWFQGFLYLAFIRHRLAWLKKKGNRFGRGSTTEGSKAIKVHRINEGPETPQEQDVVYRVHPKNQKASTVPEAVQGLQSMSAEAFAGSTALRVHEFGEDIKSKGKLLAIPIKTRPNTPKKWLEKNPGKKLEFRPSKKFGPFLPGQRSTGVLYEVTKVRGRGRPKKGHTLPALREKLRLRFVLQRFIDMKPTLGMYATWDELAGERDQLFRNAAEKMQQQLQRGDPRDF